MRVRWLSFLMIFSLACALSRQPEVATTPLPTLSFSTATPAQTASPSPISPTASPSPAANSQNNAPPPVVNGGGACSPRADWTASYTVKVGETLGGLAVAINSTAQEIAQANCLNSPDLVQVGQVIRLPRLPASTTSTGNNTTNTGNTSTGSNTTNTGNTSAGSNTTNTGNTSTGSNTTNTGNTSTGSNTSNPNTTGAPVFSQALSIRPLLTINGALVAVQATIALEAGPVANADRVEFYSGLSANDPDPVLIGTDNDPFDGTPLSYDFNTFDEVLVFWAVAINEAGATRGTPITLRYDPQAAQAAGPALTISPFLGFDGSIFTLQHGAPVTISWAGAPSAAGRVEFYTTSTSGGPTILIGTDNNLADGAAISWAVPEWILSSLVARAFVGGGSQDSGVYYVYSEGEGQRPSD